MIHNVTYLVSDGIYPAVLIKTNDGHQHGFEFINKQWKPSEAAKLFHDAKVVSRGSFIMLFPDVGTPSELNPG